MLLEAIFKVKNNLNASLSYAMDTGELSKNIGFMLGIKWSGGTFVNLDKP
jgi:hypothetical protein